MFTSAPLSIRNLTNSDFGFAAAVCRVSLQCPSCGLNFESPSIVVQPQPHSSIIVDRGHHSIWLEVMRPLQRPSTKCHKHANSISHWGTEKCDGIKWGMVERKRRRSENGQFPQNFNAFL